jgi:hypothetical protein
MCHYNHGEIFIEGAIPEFGNTSTNHRDYSDHARILKTLLRVYPRVFAEFSAVVANADDKRLCAHIKLILSCQCGAQARPQYFEHYQWVGGVFGEAIDVLEKKLELAEEQRKAAH